MGGTCSREVQLICNPEAQRERNYEKLIGVAGLDSYKVDLKEIGWGGGVDMIQLAKGRSGASDIHDKGAFGCTDSWERARLD